MNAERNRCGRRLYRDRENAVLMGVCAGVAEFFDVNVTAVRLVTLAAAIFFTLPVLVLYFVLGWLLLDRPLYYYGASESAFWRREFQQRGRSME